MHAEALRFAARALDAAGCLPAGARVLEFGSRDVNGSPRALLPRGLAYTGVDVVRGPGVDVVGDAADYTPVRAPHLILCMEVLEHTSRAAEIVKNAGRVLLPGGYFLMTCAMEKRSPHSATGGRPKAGEYYGNVDPKAVREWLRKGRLTDVVLFEEHRHRGDLYVLARKPVRQS